MSATAQEKDERIIELKAELEEAKYVSYQTILKAAFLFEKAESKLKEAKRAELEWSEIAMRYRDAIQSAVQVYCGDALEILEQTLSGEQEQEADDD